jgi:hypothetical protein
MTIATCTIVIIAASLPLSILLIARHFLEKEVPAESSE